MYELSAFLSWLAGTAAGILLSVLQELGQKYEWRWVNNVNQKVLAIALGILAGLIAALFEVILGVDLFSDVQANGIADIIMIVGSVIFAGQTTWALAFRRRKTPG